MTNRDFILSRLKNYPYEQVYNMYSDFVNHTNSSCSESSYKKLVNKIRNEQNIPPYIDKQANEKSNEEITDSIYTALIESTTLKTPEDLIDYLKIDLNKWELSKFIRNTWGSSSNPSFQLKGEFKKIKIENNKFEILSIIKDAVEQYKPKKVENKTKIIKSDNMLEIDIVDHHFGQKSIESETGEESNIELSRIEYLRAVEYMINSSTVYNPSKIVLIIGSDFFNTDTIQNTTTAGTFQSEDSVWKETFRLGLETCIDAIELCRSICNVEVKIIQGNHDFTRSFYLGCAIKQRYLNDASVVVDNSDAFRKYMRWGSSLICFTHGDKEVKGKLPLIISRECQRDFAECKFIEVHQGHLHSEKEALVLASEDCTIKTRILSSLAARDDWHSQKGYSHIRESQGFIWNKDKGNIAILKYHL